MGKTIEKLDNKIIGLVFGLFLPIIGFIIAFLIKGYGTVPFKSFVAMAGNASDYQQDILILCLIPNMLMIYFSNFRWKINKFTMGLVAITVVELLILIFLTY